MFAQQGHGEDGEVMGWQGRRSWRGSTVDSRHGPGPRVRGLEVASWQRPGRTNARVRARRTHGVATMACKFGQGNGGVDKLAGGELG